MVMVNVIIGRDDLLKNSDVEVKLVDHYYSLSDHDYIHSVSLTDEILNYLAKKKLLSEDELNRMYKENYTKKIILPYNLVFDNSEKIVKHTQAEYNRKAR